jgi:hypothetical protein
MEEFKCLLLWIILLDHSLWAHEPLSDPSKRSIIMKISLLMLGFGNIEELPLFLAQEMASIAHAMEVSMHSSVQVLYLLSSLSPQELFGGVVRGYENDTLAAGFIGPFSYDGSFRCLWVTWRSESFILPVNFYNCFKNRYNSMEDPQGIFFPFYSRHIFSSTFSSCIMTKYSHLSNSSLTRTHSTMVPLRAGRSRSRLFLASMAT